MKRFEVSGIQTQNRSISAEGSRFPLLPSGRKIQASVDSIFRGLMVETKEGENRPMTDEQISTILGFVHFRGEAVVSFSNPGFLMEAINICKKKGLGPDALITFLSEWSFFGDAEEIPTKLASLLEKKGTAVCRTCRVGAYRKGDDCKGCKLSPSEWIKELPPAIVWREMIFDLPTLKEFKRRDLIQREFARSSEAVVEGMDECPYCRCRKVLKYNKQTRAGDEPETIFLTCTSCRRKWRN